MRLNLIAATSLLVIGSVGTFASSITQLVVFGDSLSDNGNAASVLAAAGTPLSSMDYAPNAFTDGPNTTPATTGPFGLWVDQFAAKMGIPDPQPYLLNPLSNTNYAFAGADTGSASPQDISNQVAAFSATNLGKAPSDALYTLWGGANDLFHGANSGKTAADNLYGNILTLYGEGAKDFLWFNLPNLGDTPLGATLGTSALNSATAAFNTEWATDLAALQAKGVDVIGVDVNKLFTELLSDPSMYGLTNVTSPAQGTSANPNTYLFWDQEHPTTAVDALIADAAYDAFNGAATAAPEPAEAGLMVLGLGAGWLLLRRRRV